MTTKNSAGVTAGTSSFSYDPGGNLTGRTLAGQSAQALAWDAEGELSSVAQDGNGDGDTTDTNEKDSYLYSADGERLVRTQDGASTLYLPGGAELTAYADGSASTANRYYSFNGKTITTRAAVGATGQITVIPDHHGTPMLQVDQSTNRVTRQYTDPFGATRGAVVGDADADGRLDGTSPAWVGDHGYLDKPEDSTGLTAVGARMYDPVLGKFISVDPVMDLADPQQWNAYSYSNGNPTTLSDPTGMKPLGGNGGAEENKWANSVSKRMNEDARERSRKAETNTRVPLGPWHWPTQGYSPSTNNTMMVMGLAEAGAALTVDAAKATYVEKLRLKAERRSGNPKISEPAKAAYPRVRQNGVVKLATKVTLSPAAKLAGYPGAIIGWTAGYDGYVHSNGGDKPLAAAQATLDTGAALAGAAAGAKVGAVAGMFFGGPPGAAVGAAVGAVFVGGGMLALSMWNNANISNGRKRELSG